MNKKDILFIFLTITLLFTGIKGMIFVLNNVDFYYNRGLLWGVYYILAVYLLMGIIVAILTIMKLTKCKNMNEVSIKVYESAIDIPVQWDSFCKDNFYMNKTKLIFLEQVNKCSQKYYMVYNKNNILESCFVMFPFKYEFTKKIRLNVKLIFLPVSVADPGIVAKTESTALHNCLKKIKGIKLILSTSEDFKLLNGIRYEGLPNCVMKINWDTFEKYINSMRSRYRHHINKTLRKREPLTKKILNNNLDFNQEMLALYKQVMNNNEYIIENLNIDFFHNNFSKTIILEYKGKPKAFVQFAEDRDKLIAEFCGFDYKDRDKYDLYNNINLLIIEYAIENKFKMIDIGQSAEGTKLKFGAELEPKYSWIFFNGNKICNFILKFTLLHNNKPRKIYEYNVFK